MSHETPRSKSIVKDMFAPANVLGRLIQPRLLRGIQKEDILGFEQPYRRHLATQVREAAASVSGPTTPQSFHDRDMEPAVDRFKTPIQQSVFQSTGERVPPGTITDDSARDSRSCSTTEVFVPKRPTSPGSEGGTPPDLASPDPDRGELLPSDSAQQSDSEHLHSHPLGRQSNTSLSPPSRTPQSLGYTGDAASQSAEVTPSPIGPIRAHSKRASSAPATRSESPQTAQLGAHLYPKLTPPLDGRTLHPRQVRAVPSSTSDGDRTKATKRSRPPLEQKKVGVGPHHMADILRRGCCKKSANRSLTSRECTTATTLPDPAVTPLTTVHRGLATRALWTQSLPL